MTTHGFTTTAATPPANRPGPAVAGARVVVPSTHAQPPFPLPNLRVTSFGWFWSAPMLGHLLADAGADVTRVESWSNPCKTRLTMKAQREDVHGEAFFFHNIMRSQRSISLDLSKQEAIALAHDLVRQSDVVIENFRPGVLDRLGLGYRHLRALRPDLVMISLSAFGQDGPLSQATGLGNNLACFAGVDSLQGYDALEPRAFAIAHLDPFNGTAAALALLAALWHRQRTGEGQYIDLAQAETAIAMFGAPILDVVFNKRVHHPRGNKSLEMAPHGLYPAKGDDAWLSIAVRTEEEWAGFRRAMGDPRWAHESRFGDAYRRLRNSEALDEHIAAWTRERDSMEAALLLQRHGVATFPAMSGEILFADPHFTQRRSWLQVEQVYGPEWIYGIHWKFSETPPRVRRGSPTLGMDNEYIFGDVLGVPEARRFALEAAKVVY